MALNHTAFQGRLTKDIEKRTTQSGISNVSFTLAWSEKYKETETKCFLRCKAWRGTADFLEKYLHDKGTEMIVEGRLGTEEWTDKDGGQHSQTVLSVDKVHFCGWRRADGQQTFQQTEPTPVPPAQDGDLPF